jgi:hypothetical protein
MTLVTGVDTDEKVLVDERGQIGGSVRGKKGVEETKRWMLGQLVGREEVRFDVDSAEFKRIRGPHLVALASHFHGVRNSRPCALPSILSHVLTTIAPW